MKYLRTTKRGAIHYEMSDGRYGAAYPSGYARVSVKDSTGLYPELYQINKKVKYSDLPVASMNQVWLRIKERSLNSAIDLLKNYDAKNCK